MVNQKNFFHEVNPKCFFRQATMKFVIQNKIQHDGQSKCFFFMKSIQNVFFQQGSLLSKIKSNMKSIRNVFSQTSCHEVH
jgi:hypothetical protein